jgi:hypothetical protein
MKKIWAVVVLIAIGAGLFFVFKPRNSTPQNPAAATASKATVSANNFPTPNSPAPAAPKNPESVPATLPAGAGTNSATGLVAPAASLNPSAPALPVSSLPALTVLDNARVAMKNYGATFGENPVGTNSEITEALMGKNPKGINFITPESGLRVNEQGEMVDAYGTPFFFHQLSGKEMEIRSAGEDRKMWTFDDLVTR